MRIPHVHKYHLESVDKTPSAEVEISIKPESYLDDLVIFDDKKEYIKWIIRMKHLIRSSYEYEELIQFLRKRCGMDHCGIHPNLSDWNGFRIERHHTPFTMEDIVDIITRKRLERNESLKMSEIGREVMEVHYLGLVGLYPLCMLCHGFAHSDSGDTLFIPMANVFGDPVKFVDIYGNYMSESMRTKWSNVEILNKSYTMITNTLPIELQRKYIYVKPVEDRDEEVISTNKLMDFISSFNK